LFEKLLCSGLIMDLSFMGQGCAISRASASLMTERLKGKSLEEAAHEMNWVTGMLMGEVVPERSAKEVGDLVALGGVRQFPARIKCATLAWHTFDTALKGDKTVSTE
jgi:nitrogen fixation NifU-like protein